MPDNTLTTVAAYSNRPFQVLEISSPQNPRFKTWLKILEGKGIKKHEEALMGGRKFLEEIPTQFPHKVRAIIVRHIDEIATLSVPAGCIVYVLPQPLFDQLDIYGVKVPLLVIAAPALPEWDETLQEGLTVFLPFQNPINLGTTIRTAAALGAAVVLLKEAASLYLPKSLRASGPALFQTPVFAGPSLQQLAQLHHLPIYALSPIGENLFDFPFQHTMGLVAGMEGPGLDEFWSEKRRLSIPMQAGVESLNAAIALGMAMACRLAKL